MGPFIGSKHRFALCFFVLLIVTFATAWTARAVAQTATQFAGTSVGQTSATQTVTVTMSAGGIATSPQVLTRAKADGDFIEVAGGTCAANASYSAGQQCTVNVQFAPRYPGLRAGAVTVRSGGGSLLGMAPLSGIGQGSLPVLAPGQIDTIAGNTEWIFQGDGGPATASSIFLPTGVVVDGAGNVYLSDSQNNRVRRIDAVTAIISTIAGNGTPGYQADNVPGSSTMVNTPAGLALDGAGNIYFADTGNHIIRRVDAVTGIITTVAGSPGVQGYTGDGEAATQARLSFPESIAFDPSGNLLIADTGNHVLREVDAVSGTIRTIAGNGTPGYNGDNRAAATAQLNSPWGLAIAPDGSIYIADLNNNRVRRIDATGTITTVAGTGARDFSGDGGSPTAATLNEPAAVVLDAAGDVYVADAGNNRVREINAATQLISTLSGTSSEQFSGDGGAANLASLYGPNSLAFDSGGDLFIADMFHNRIRRINAQQTTLQYATIKVGKVSPPQAVELANIGNAPMTLQPPTLVNAAIDPATSTCASGVAISPANVCNLGAEFAPLVIGNPVHGSIALKSDSSATAPSILLAGQVLTITPTTTAITSSANPSLVNAAVTFTATVTNDGSPETGTVLFFDGTTQLCSVTLAGTTATCSSATLALGQHSITASYAGDANNAASVSTALLQVVKQQAALTLTATPNPAVVASSVALAVTVAAPTGTASGNVTFYDGTSPLGSVALSAQATASLNTAQLAPGTHSLSVQYSGDASNMPGQSNTIAEVIQQAATTTMLAASSSTPVVGSPLTLTAQIISSNGLTPTGTVQFNNGSTSLGSASLGANGTVALVLSSLLPGPQSIVASYSGDTDDAASTSVALVVNIQQIATTTTLTADANPVAAGANLHLTAAVNLQGNASAAQPTGTVTFSEGANTLGIVTVDPTGHAVLGISTLAAGTHTLVAAYSGNTDDAPSTAAALSEVVQSTASSVALDAGAAATLAGQPVTMIATVTSSTATPAGVVNFLDGSATLGQAQLNAQGIASFTTTALAVGNHALAAAYVGSAQFGASTSAAVAHVVSLATTALTLAGPVVPIDAGASFSMSCTLSGNGNAPTGSLTLRDGGMTIATQTITASGAFTFPNLALAVGTHQITAIYSGDADNAGATSAAVAVVVQLAPTTTTLVSSLNPATLGQNVVFTATVSSDSPHSGGAIHFMDGATLLGSAPVAGNGTASFSTTTLTVGAHAISAVYQGDADHAASNAPVVNEQIVQTVAMLLSSSLNPSPAGTGVLFSVAVVGSATVVPTGSVIFREGATKLAMVNLDASGSAAFSTAALAVGSHAITASYSGDTNYAATTADLLQVVQSDTTQILLTASANPATFGAPLTMVAKVTGNGAIASGNVSFSDGTSLLGSAALDATGTATFSTSSLTPGMHALLATYAGSASAAASISAPLAITVEQTTTVALATSANPSATLSAITLTAVVANKGAVPATGVVSFSDGATPLGSAILDATGNATLTLPSLSAGTHVLQASYGGDAVDFAATSAGIAQVVQLRPTGVTLTAISTDPANPLQTTLIAVVRWTGPATPTGTITFATGAPTPGIATLDVTGVATLDVVLQAGTASVIATYSGDAAYASSASTATTVSSQAATQFTLKLDPAVATIATKEHMTVNLALASIQNFTDTLQLGCLGLPFAATCTFSSPQVKLAAGGTATVQLTIDTADPLGAGAEASLRQRGRSGALLCFLPVTLLLVLSAGRRRIRARPLLGMLLVLAAAGNATGCAGLQVNSTPPGTYSFKVTAAGVATGITASQTMTLTVTQ